MICGPITAEVKKALRISPRSSSVRVNIRNPIFTLSKPGISSIADRSAVDIYKKYHVFISWYIHSSSTVVSNSSSRLAKPQAKFLHQKFRSLDPRLCCPPSAHHLVLTVTSCFRRSSFTNQGINISQGKI